MSLFNRFPFTNGHELNLDWILKIWNSLRGGSAGQILAKKSGADFDFKWVTGGGGGGGTTDYTDLSNKPQINGVPLIGNKTSSQLNINIPAPYTLLPNPVGTASAGSSNKFARGDHVHPGELFFAVYGSTTATEVETAYQANKEILCITGGIVYRMFNRESSTKFNFSALTYIGGSTYFEYLFLNGSTWTSSNKYLPAAGTSTPEAPGATGFAGYSNNYARADHRHPEQTIPAASNTDPAALATTAAPGTANTFSRSDHVHPLPMLGALGSTVSISGNSSKTIDLTTGYYFVIAYGASNGTRFLQIIYCASAGTVSHNEIGDPSASITFTTGTRQITYNNGLAGAFRVTMFKVYE